MTEHPDDGLHRPDAYRYYSQTTSGWTLYTNPHAPADRRWKITHEMWGERFFKTHEEIPLWTCGHMRDKFAELQILQAGRERERLRAWFASVAKLQDELEKAGKIPSNAVRELVK